MNQFLKRVFKIFLSLNFIQRKYDSSKMHCQSKQGETTEADCDGTFQVAGFLIIYLYDFHGRFKSKRPFSIRVLFRTFL